MTRESLATASETLESADETTDDAGERLESLADQLDTLATRDPDHGRLARIENALSDLEDSDVSDQIGSAHESVTAFRETVEGV